MKKKTMNAAEKLLLSLFVLVMLAFSGFMAWYTVTIEDLEFRKNDAGITLETNQGQERRQRKEYDQAVIDLAEAKQKLEEMQPLAEEATEKAEAQKEEKKRLKEQIKELESMKNAAREGGQDHE